MSEQWIHVVDWERHQHPDTGRSRVPPWIKTFTELLSSEAYLTLTEHRALMLHRLWLEYARTRRRLPLDTRSLSRRLALRVTTADLESLNHAGYIMFSASKDASKVAGLEESRGEKSREDSPLVPLTAEQESAFKILNEGVEKQGYCVPKFSRQRFHALTRQYPDADLIHEAEKLRDWEMFGAGERKDTRDGITRLRNWLDKASVIAVEPSEVDYPLHPLSAAFKNGDQ